MVIVIDGANGGGDGTDLENKMMVKNSKRAKNNSVNILKKV